MLDKFSVFMCKTIKKIIHIFQIISQTHNIIIYVSEIRSPLYGYMHKPALMLLPQNHTLSTASHHTLSILPHTTLSLLPYTTLSLLHHTTLSV